MSESWKASFVTQQPSLHRTCMCKFIIKNTFSCLWTSFVGLKQAVWCIFTGQKLLKKMLEQIAEDFVLPFFFFLTWFTDVKRDKGKRLTCKIKHTLGKSFRLNVELILNYLTCKWNIFVSHFLQLSWWRRRVILWTWNRKENGWSKSGEIKRIPR